MAGVSMDGVPNLSPEFQKAYQTAVQMERRPIQQLAERKGNIEAKAKLLTDVVGKVENVRKILPKLRTPEAVRELALKSGDNKVVEGTLDRGATPGKYELEVKQLAEPPRALSNGFPDADDTSVGSGYFTFTTLNGEDKEVYVDEENGTLSGLAKTINGAGLGIRASVIQDQSDPDNPYRLAISGNRVGASEDVEYPEFYFADGDQDFFIDNQRPATNAVIRYQGFDIESASNEIKDLIPGVTLKLKGISDLNRPVTIDIDHDMDKAKTKVKDLVDNLNQVLGFIQGQNKMDATTDTSKTLGGDYSIRVTEDRLRQALQPMIHFGGDEDQPTIRMLADLGIQFNKEGTLTLDDKKLEAALARDFDGVADFLAGDGFSTGLANRLDQTLRTVSGAGNGVLTNEQKTYQDRIKRMQQDIDAKEKVAKQKADDLKVKLSKAQAAMDKLQNQTAQLGAIGNGGGLASQLIG